MKNKANIYLYIAGLFLAIGVSSGQTGQNRNPAGLYSFEGVHDPQGSTNMVLSPDSVFIIAGFGVMEYGKWDIYKNYLILEPVPLLPDDFYIVGEYNPELEHIHIHFDNFSQAGVLYSFDNDDFTAVMHPVFNPWPNPNCASYTYATEFKNGEHHSLQLAVRNSGSASVSTTYNFILQEEYNKYMIIACDRSDGFAVPILMVIEGENLIHESGVLARKWDYEDLDDEEKDVIEKAKLFMEDPDPVAIYMLDSGQDTFMAFASKEVRKIFYDDDNLFEAKCNESYYDYHHDYYEDNYQIYNDEE